jgi:prepilin-type N-terminal cleavage/methylation domain-containing protein/prepilin-type processing-associated H-X9-DG protein
MDVAVPFFGMKSNPPTCRAGAFTLVELLCVMAIIAILAALMLPALDQSKARVKRVECVNNLHQLGMAFQMFMHEHDNKFPMAVPMAEGGSQEFVQNGYAVGGEFYFSYRHFQALSNELSSPAILICPADTRRPTTNFTVLQNSNVSYFVGVKATFANPDSVLAGDRNLTANSTPVPSILRGETNSRLWWTRELHQFKGNVLFADGRVEEWNSAALATAAGTQLAGADLFLPTVVAAATSPAYSYAGNPGFSRANSGSSAYEAPPATPSAGRPEPMAPAAPASPALSRSRQPIEVPAGPQNPPLATGTNPPAPDLVSTSLVAAETIVPEPAVPEMSPFDERVARDLRWLIFGTYLLVLLLFLARLAFLCWRRWQRNKEQRLGGF